MRRAFVVAVGFLLAASLVSCTAGAAPHTIAIVNNLASLDPIVEVLEAELSRADPDIEFVYLDRNAPLEGAIDELLALDPDVVVSLNTPLSLAVGERAGQAGVPQVFGMVTDPLGSNLVESNEEPGRNRTGVGLLQIERTVRLAVLATGADKIAVLHQPSDAASLSGLVLAEQAAAKLGVELVPMIVELDEDLDEVLRGGYPEGADVFLVVGSPFAARKLGNISLVARTWDIPSASALTVDALPPGFALGVAPNSADIGYQMAQRVLAILNGGDAGTIPIGVAENVTIIDLELARGYGMALSDAVLADFDKILGST